MPKHNQSARLGNLSDFSERPTQPPAREFPDTDIEARVANLERAVNQMLLQLSDISEQLDQPRRDQVLGTPPKQQPKPQEKPKPASTPEPQPEPLSEEQVATLSDAIHQLLLDGTPRSKKEVCEAVGCDKQQYAQAREHLINTERMQGGDGNDIVAQKICNVPGGLAIWTQEQVDAELQKRKLAKTAAADDNT